MNFNLYLLLISLVLTTSCQSNQVALKTRPKAVLSGKVNSEARNIRVYEQEVPLEENGSFKIAMDFDYSTLINVEAGGKTREVFVQPGKEVILTIEKDSIQFTGAFIAENKHLQMEAELNEELGAYLESNWYTLHKKEEHEYIGVMDSLRNIFFTKLDQQAFTPEFIEVNTASINYAFDRIIMRYPMFHFYFTGNRVSLSEEAQNNLKSNIDEPNYRYLESYKKYVNTWFDKTLEDEMQQPLDTSTYEGVQKLNLALDLISKTFESPALREFWSFQFIKSHIDQHTWINGKTVLNDFIKNCSSPQICEEATLYKEELLAEREGHDIHVYKNAKGYQLEAHIFKPENFDQSKAYPTLAAFHGGGWISGHASWTFTSAQHAAENGMIGVAVEYRLSNQADITPDEAMDDTRDLIKWLRDHADSLSINPNKIVGKGISAGGHLIAAISVIQEAPESTVPNALVLVSPALGTSDEYFVGLAGNREKANQLSPVENLSAELKMPPTLILQGRTDNLTPTPIAQAFKTKMDASGHKCELIIYEGCGHLFTPSHLDDTGWPQSDPAIWKKAVDEEDKFLNRLGFTN